MKKQAVSALSKTILPAHIKASFAHNNPTCSRKKWDSPAGNWGTDYILENNMFKLIYSMASFGLGTFDDSYYDVYLKELVPFLFFFKKVRYTRLQIDEAECEKLWNYFWDNADEDGE